MAKLMIRRGDVVDQEISLTDHDVRIGRGDQNDIVLRDPAKAVSRFHAELRYDNGRYVLVDLNSQNGLWVRGRREPAIVLEPGVPVTIGPYSVTLADAAKGAASSAKTTAQPAETLVPGGKRSVSALPPRLPPPAPAAPRSTAGSSRGPVPAPRWLPRLLVVGAVAASLVVVVLLVRYLTSNGDEEEVQPSLEAVERLQQHLAAARTFLDRGESDNAIEEADLALAIDPANATARDLRAQAESRKPPGLEHLPPPPPPPPPPEQPPRQPSSESLPSVPSVPPGPSGPSGPQPLVERRPGESLNEWTARDRLTAERYDRARTALENRSFAGAVVLLGEIQRDEPDYRDVPLLLARAREGQRAIAREALETATRLETAGDWVAAVAQYERVKEIDPAMAGVAEESAKRVRGRMMIEGTDAFTRARQYDAVGRIDDAVKLYERAHLYLPDDDPNKKTAKERLDLLRTKQ